jgi:hypothetical protein
MATTRNTPETSPGEVSTKRAIELAPQSRLNQEIIDRLEDFFEMVPPAHFSRTIRCLFVTTLLYDHENLPLHFEEMLNQLDFFFYFLDTAQDEMS